MPFASPALEPSAALPETGQERFMDASRCQHPFKGAATLMLGVDDDDWAPISTWLNFVFRAWLEVVIQIHCQLLRYPAMTAPL